jgi:hypothetical protein
VQHLADAVPSDVRFYFPELQDIEVVGDEFGRLVPLSRVVIHFISLKGKLKIE